VRLFLKLLAGIAGLLVLIVVAAAIAVSTIDVNALVGPIQKRVKEATGRDLTIRGGISLKLSLEPKLVVEDVSLGNAPWGKSPQMLTAKRVEAQMRLLPLLRRRFEIAQFRLVEPRIALETDSGGQGNWDFGASPLPGAAPAPQAGAGAMSALAVGDVSIADGALSYRDGKTGNVTNVVIESLSLHARDPQSQISAQFRGKVADVAVAVEGDLGPLDTLAQRRWPYPITLQGDVNSQKTTVSAKLRADGPIVTLDELQVATGSSSAKGTLAIARDGGRPKVTLALNATTLAVADLRVLAPVAGAAAASSPAAGKSTRGYVFTDAPIDFAPLVTTDADINVSTAALILADGRRIDNVRVQASVRGGRIDAPMLAASAFGGTATARLAIDATRVADPAITLHLDADALDLGALLAAFGEKRDVRGGKTSVRIDVVAHGVSPRQWVSDMSGTATAIIGPATLTNFGLGDTAALDRLGAAINPFRKVDPSTELTCGVVRLPLKDGVATVDRSIAMETKKLGASASGTLDFRNESLDLSFKPQIREGIHIEIPQIAQLVRLRGPFTSPTVGIDATATAATVARLGAAIGTGGLSMLGETLLSGAAAAGKVGPCQEALAPTRGNQATAQTQAGAPSSPRPEDAISNAIGKLFRH
jgi:AsmA family protein